jgi:chromosomal replication initiator protein
VGLLVWEKCLERLQDEFSSQQFNTWIRPLQVRLDESCLRLLAPNPYVRDKVEEKFLERIQSLINDLGDPASPLSVDLGVGSRDRLAGIPVRGEARDNRASGGLIGTFRFETFVEGNSNELARAAAVQVSENAGQSYNPLLLYGGVGLGKTHLMHAVGNEILMKTPQARVVYLHSQRFVQDMVKALQTGTMQDFMHHYRSVDALLIDDIQFFANKMRSQEEFFHVFNALYERANQMVFTCDRYPSEVKGLEERLKSRFVYGLTVEVEAPDLETRVAILLKKAEAEGITLDSDVAFYMAERIRSNVRELEGALRRVLASAQFGGHRITVEHVRRSLRDLIAIQDRQVSVDNIQRIVAEYYNIKHSDMLSKRRNRTVARPRQMAMSLAKELTQHSLPELGDFFGGRDHTTVIHACRKIDELKETNADLAEDYRNLSRLLNR